MRKRDIVPQSPITLLSVTVIDWLGWLMRDCALENLSKDLYSHFMIEQIDCRVFAGDRQMFLGVSYISLYILGAGILLCTGKLT